VHTNPNVDTETRMRVCNLIRDRTADAYCGWHFVVALQAGGGLSAQRFMMNRTYIARAKAKALAAAGRNFSRERGHPARLAAGSDSQRQ
jgi:4-hydroxybutyryl-CoA dehydratase/vinylacetyl-CoA-Delta-isomerase